MKNMIRGSIALAAIVLSATACTSNGNVSAGQSGQPSSGGGNTGQPSSGSGGAGQPSSGGGGAGQPVSHPSGPSQPSSGSGGGSGSGGSGGSAATPRCHTNDLSGEAGFADAGAGQRYVRLTFRNTSGHTCTTYGWPGLSLGSGTVDYPTTVVRQGSPYIVTLTPGAAASVQVHWTVVPALDETGASCEPTPGHIKVIPPNETTQLSINWTYGPVCQHGRLTVNPIVPFA